jgi:hypothetical protein
MIMTKIVLDYSLTLVDIYRSHNDKSACSSSTYSEHQSTEIVGYYL